MTEEEINNVMDDDVLVIRNVKQYKEYLEEYSCKDHKEFDDTLYYTYGITVVYNDEMEAWIKANELD